jgi:hypothetical protein
LTGARLVNPNYLLRLTAVGSDEPGEELRFGEQPASWSSSVTRKKCWRRLDIVVFTARSFPRKVRVMSIKKPIPGLFGAFLIRALAEV